MSKYHSFSLPSHKGAKHKGNEPCQDASSSSNSSSNNAKIVIVADGHGSSTCFRSDIGSQKAIDATKSTVKFFLKKLPRTITDPRYLEIQLSKMVKQIINKWLATVIEHEKDNPLQDDPRLQLIAEKYKERYLNKPDYRCHAYGTTLMVAVMSDNLWFGFQVGDGKCVALYEDGMWEMPIPWDSRCVFNMTTSICDDDSLSSFRYWFGIKATGGGYTEYGYDANGQLEYERTSSRPLAIFIASDGVDDSYPIVNNDKYVKNFYRNRIVRLAENGFDSFKNEVNEFAKYFADRGSRDDVSIAGIVIKDFKGRENMVTQMKKESGLHEAKEMATAKRRDATEKRDAVNAVERNSTVNQTHIETIRKACEEAEKEAETLEARVRRLEESDV
jgi:serine/threonine protein phosphatase PrpC